MAVDLTVTRVISLAARKGLDLYEAGRGGDGLVDETIDDARVMARRGALSEDKVRKMPGWFARHATDKTPDWDKPGEETPGYVAWLLWGGDTAQAWAEEKVAQLDAEAEDEERAIDPAALLAELDEDDEEDGKPRIVVSDVDDTILRNGTQPIDRTVMFLKEIPVPIVILTGRTEAERDETAAQLERAGVEYAMLFTNNTDAETIDYKRDTIRSLLDSYDVILAIENDAEIRAAYEELDVPVVDPSQLPELAMQDAGTYRKDLPGIEQKALPLDDDALEVETPEMLCDALAEQLADLVAFGVRAQGAHWNVKGPDFSEWHAVFGALYEDIDASIDPTAENILKLGYDAPGSLTQMSMVRSLEDPDTLDDSPEALAADLLGANEEIREGWQEVFDAATRENQQGIANYAAGQIDVHQKWSWQLRSSLGLQTQNTMMGDAEETPPAEDVEMESSGIDPTGLAVPDKMVRSKVGRPVEFAAPVTRAFEDTRGVEHRVHDDKRIEVREMSDIADAGGMTFYGYAAVFDSPSEPLPFTEVIKPGAFRNTLRSRNEVKMLMNHDTGRVLASRRAGTLRLTEDATGLRVEADLPDTTDGRDLAYLIKRGDITTMSFGFTVPPGGDYWSDENNRELRDVRLHEISLAPFAAYTHTSTAVRSLDILADKTGLDANTLADAMDALERGETLTPEQADLLTESVVKLREAKADAPLAPSLAELQAQLDAKRLAA